MELKKVLFNWEMVLNSFAHNTRSSTRDGKETWGALCGVYNQENDVYAVNSIIIPEQECTTTSCEVTSAGLHCLLDIVKDNNLIQIGWIHTHPNFDVFMSSVDLHQQRNHQLLLPETIAIVVSPKTKKYGIYSLTEKGMEAVGNCLQHDHHETCSGCKPSKLYQVPKHYGFCNTDSIKILDFRDVEEKSDTEIMEHRWIQLGVPRDPLPLHQNHPNAGRVLSSPSVIFPRHSGLIVRHVYGERNNPDKPTYSQITRMNTYPHHPSYGTSSTAERSMTYAAVLSRTCPATTAQPLNPAVEVNNTAVAYSTMPAPTVQVRTSTAVGSKPAVTKGTPVTTNGPSTAAFNTGTYNTTTLPTVQSRPSSAVGLRPAVIKGTTVTINQPSTAAFNTGTYNTTLPTVQTRPPSTVGLKPAVTKGTTVTINQPSTAAFNTGTYKTTLPTVQTRPLSTVGLKPAVTKGTSVTINQPSTAAFNTGTYNTTLPTVQTRLPSTVGLKPAVTKGTTVTINQPSTAAFNTGTYKTTLPTVQTRPLSTVGLKPAVTKGTTVTINQPSTAAFNTGTYNTTLPTVQTRLPSTVGLKPAVTKGTTVTINQPSTAAFNTGTYNTTLPTVQTRPPSTVGLKPAVTKGTTVTINQPSTAASNTGNYNTTPLPTVQTRPPSGVGLRPAVTKVTTVATNQPSFAYTTKPPPTGQTRPSSAIGSKSVDPTNMASKSPSATPILSGYEDHAYLPATGETTKLHIAIQSCKDYIIKEEICCTAVSEHRQLRDCLVKLENTMVDIATCNIANGVVYMASFIIDNVILYTRYFDNGKFTNCYQKTLCDTVKSEAPKPLQYINWCTMTNRDLEKRNNFYTQRLKQGRESKTLTTRRQPPSGMKLPDLMKRATNFHNQLLEYCGVKPGSTCISDRIKLHGTMLFVDKTSNRTALLNSEDKTISHLLGGAFAELGIHLDTLIEQHTQTGNQSTESVSAMLDNFHPSNTSFLNQESVINAIENDTTPNGRDGKRYSDYFSIGNARYIPQSKRNRLLYYYRKQNNRGIENTITSILSETAPQNPEPELQSARTTSRTVLQQTAPQTIQENITSNDDSAWQPQAPFLPVQTTPYGRFSNCLIDKGTISWRVRQERVDELVMSDIDLKSGYFQNNGFVILKRTSSSRGVTFRCSCAMAKRMNNIENQFRDMKCVHEQFYLQSIEPHIFGRQVTLESDTRLGKKLLEAISDIGKPIVILGDNKKYHRLSVLSSKTQTSAIVTLHDNRLKCTNGYCESRKGHVRKIISISSDDVCEHLQQLHQHRDEWIHLITDRPGDEAPSKLTFNVNTGLWEFHGCVSSHTPRTQHDTFLSEKTQTRLAIHQSHPGYAKDELGFLVRVVNGEKMPFELVPPLDTEKICLCGAKYFNKENPDGLKVLRHKHPMTVYLQHGAAKYNVYDRDCINRIGDCQIQYSGSQDCLHILTSATAAGDEIGWKFLDLRRKTSGSALAFCEMMQSEYEIAGSKVHFMCRTTFEDWITSWMVSFRIDFRQPCKMCGHNPEAVACDGTLLGVSFRNSNFEPIETSKEGEVYSCHRRTDRQFFAYSKDAKPEVKQRKKLAAKYLEHFICLNTSTLTENEVRTSSGKRKKSSLKKGQKKAKITVPQVPIEEMRGHVIENVHESCKELLSLYVESALSHGVLEKLSEVLKVFVTEKPISCLLNYRFLDELLSICSNILNGQLYSADSIADELPEIYELFQSAQNDNELILIARFVLFLVETISDTHANDGPIQATRHVSDYNPLKGHAYYFREDGSQIREMPEYKETKEAIGTCEKKSYAESSRSGSTYIFLMFCPKHYGHCWGFHMINNEGPKDAFAPPFLYMEKAPKEVFYDNSCNLEEYSLNREPMFWRCTRFFHDTFHGFFHSCPYPYNHKRIPALKDFNTEVCEQFNAYVKKIRSSAYSMRQEKFIFYLQFFMYLFGEEEYLRYKKENINIDAFAEGSQHNMDES